MEEQVYLGDGVYASFDGYYIQIAVNHHTNIVVALEDEVLDSLIQYANKVFNKNYKNVKDDNRS